MKVNFKTLLANQENNFETKNFNTFKIKINISMLFKVLVFSSRFTYAKEKKTHKSI